ncbi:DNA N-6-adenine-methyltransferase [Microcoleus sp. N9_B4]|uniref:DNA N-6-adenine-methyltransferase n=1 Tax=Microcoleus sp. N9_B4 TaxID=3055386 RepID=UPI002FD4D082
MPLTGESQQLGLSESSTLPNLSPELIESWTDWEKSNFLWLFEFDFCMHKGELKKIEKFLPGTKTIRLEGMKIGSTYLQMWEVEPPRFTDKSTLIELPPNIGALEKAELISMAQEQHQLICLIERKEFELALEKLHRVRLTGVYLQEFKKKCQYGEFENQLEQAGISVRSAQNYMAIAKNWEIVEAKTKLVSLLAEENENQPTLSLRWALEAVRDEKKQLKSAAPPKDPDSWRTPNTKDQPVVALVQQALGGKIWLDPCSGSVTNHLPCAVRYYKDDNGLAEHQTWSKTVFINPPFSDPFPWVERCCFEFARGNVSAAIMLLKVGTVSNVGTGELINKYASAICHWRGRINFLNDEGNAVKGSDFDCVFVYFGARLDLFRTAFGQRGTIATIDNHYSLVNKKFLEAEPLLEPQTLKSEQKQLAAAVGLSNGRSVLPDRRDFDRELAERYDPHTVVDVFSSPMPTTPATPISENLVQPETPLAEQQFNKAKENCLNDYITAINSNLSEFNNDQIAFLAKIINEESAKRIDF